MVLCQLRQVSAAMFHQHVGADPPNRGAGGDRPLPALCCEINSSRHILFLFWGRGCRVGRRVDKLEIRRRPTDAAARGRSSRRCIPASPRRRRDGGGGGQIFTLKNLGAAACGDLLLPFLSIMLQTDGRALTWRSRCSVEGRSRVRAVEVMRRRCEAVASSARSCSRAANDLGVRLRLEGRPLLVALRAPSSTIFWDARSSSAAAAPSLRLSEPMRPDAAARRSASATLSSAVVPATTTSATLRSAHGVLGLLRLLLGRWPARPFA